MLLLKYKTENAELLALKEDRIFSSIDYIFADFIIENSSKKSDLIYFTAMFLSRSLREGSVCVDLANIVFENDNLNEAKSKLIHEFISSIKNSKAELVKTNIFGSIDDNTPFIFENEKIYLQKYWFYENSLANRILELSKNKFEFSHDLLKTDLDNLFAKEKSIDFQKIAAVNSCLNYFSVISGGPGTGKTTTAVKILFMLISQYLSKNIIPSIALTAPTGKAAAHLFNSISVNSDDLCKIDPAYKNYKYHLPTTAFTLHRLLKPYYNSPFFRYNDENKLPFNIIILDETSMTDVALMYKFIQAVDPKTHLILLGDKNQLASVQAGSVFGDICSFNAENISNEIIKKYNFISSDNIESNYSSDCGGIHSNITFLTKSHRFDENAGIGKYSKLINQQNIDELNKLIKENKDENVTFKNININKSDEAKAFELEAILKSAILENNIVTGYYNYCNSKSLKDAFDNFKKFRILCAVRRKIYGVENINRLVENILSKNKLINTRKSFYHLRPVMITQNDHTLDLFNGDIGILYHDHESDITKVFFEGNRADNDFRSYNPRQLDKYETVFAMTVHKSQGSEYSDIMLILPDHDSAVLSSELIYTGITRAREKVMILGDQKIFINSCSKKMKRMSGLQQKIYPSKTKNDKQMTLF